MADTSFATWRPGSCVLINDKKKLEFDSDALGCKTVTTQRKLTSDVLVSPGTNLKPHSGAPRLLEKIASGGQGSVYKGVKEDGSFVAVKVIRKNYTSEGILDPVQKLYITREIELLRDVSHPNLLRFEGTYETRDQWYIVTELLEGEILLEVLKSESFTEKQVRCMVCQILMCLSHLHMQGYSHGDVKLENVMVVRRNGKRVIKLIDLGLSQCLGEASSSQNGFSGTGPYKAPELCNRKKGYDAAKADSWAVGVLMYGIFTGNFPYGPEGLEANGTVNPVDYSQPVWDLVPLRTKNVLRLLLHKNPERRLSALDALELLSVDISQGSPRSPVPVVTETLKTEALRADVRRV